MPCRILICDDNDDDVYFLLHSCEAAGLSVDSTRARDGDDAVRCLTSAAEFDVVILDQRLPRRSGREVIEQARSLGHFPRCPVVILTAAMGKEREELSSTGVRVVLEKPSTLDGYLQVGEAIARLCP
jgi:CheY-like chemotaxis protein